MFSCHKCGKAYTRKYNLKKHIECNKNCDEQNINKIYLNGKIRYYCKYCDKDYCRNNYLNVHIEKEHKLELINELEVLKKEVETLKTQKSVPQINNINHTNNIDNTQISIENMNNITNNNNNQVLVQVNAFQQSNMDHIDENLAYKAFINLFHYLPQILAETNFNPDHPENHNLYLKNVKNKIYKVFDGLGFQEVSENIFFKHFIDNYLNIFDSYISKLIEEKKISTDDTKYCKFEDVCSELELYAGEHKDNLKKIPKYRKLCDSLKNVFTSSKGMIKNSMETKEHVLENGKTVDLEYKDDKIYKKMYIT